MNLRALTRGDAAVAGAAVLLLVASFLPYRSSTCGGLCDVSVSAWDTGLFPVLPSVFLLGLIGAALILLYRFQGETLGNRQVLGLRLDQWGTALSVAALWSAVWSLAGGGAASSTGFGAWLAVLALLALAGASAAAPLVPALQAPLLTDKPAVAAPQQGYAPYPGAQGGPGSTQPMQPGQPGQPGQAGQPMQPMQPMQPGHPGEQGQGQHGQYGYPGAPAGQSEPVQQAAPYGAQPPAAGYGYPAGPQDQTPAPAPAPAAPFAPFWFAVPAVRPLASKDNAAGPAVGELVPGTWYLAVDQRGTALVAQLPDGTHGLLSDTSGIQRG